MRAAALAEPLACVLHGLNRLSLSPQQQDHIFGTGPIGMLMLQVLKAEGSRKWCVLTGRAVLK